MNRAGHGFPVPGWFGKLPGSGDFVHRRLEPAFIVRWDAWLQHEMLVMRQRHPEWVESYLTAPVWCFVLAPGLLELRGAQGVLMPSVDRVGRYFPLTLLRWLADGDAPCRRWWTLAGQAALGGLHGDLDANDFDQLLQRRFSAADATADGAAEPMLELPPAGHSLWGIFDDGGAPARTLLTAGLPSEIDFDALFDLSPWPHAVPGMP